MYYLIGQVLLPNAAYNPHQLKNASKKANPEKNRSHGLHVVVMARTKSPIPILIRRALSVLPIFLDEPWTVFRANFFSNAR